MINRRVSVVTPSSSAAAWVNCVLEPCPTSTLLVSTVIRPSGSRDLNAEILETLGRAGYRVSETRSHILVLSDPYGAAFRDVRLSSDDPTIVNSEVSIEPANSFDFSYCFPPDASELIEADSRRRVLAVAPSTRR